ncbi:MAG: polyprenyl synthetase family protein [Brumimicrobium sp.]
MDHTVEYQEFLEKKINELDFPTAPKNLYDPLRYFLTLGGKRTRPTLTLLGCSLFGEPGIKAVNAAVAIELFHNFTLIHDDIMDDAPLRRGKPTVHERWSNSIGILSGDVLFVEAYKQLAMHETDVLPALLKIFSRTAKEVCEGQQMDMDFEERDDVSIDEYIEMIRLKTSVLLGAALEMGAVIAKANDNDIAKIYEFGMNVGLAFQLQDDVLDLYADPDKFGKQVGGDILSNKKTFLLLKAYEVANETQKKELNLILKEKTGEDKVSSARELFNELGVKEVAQKKMNAYYQSALENMAEINVSDECKEPLLSLAAYLMNREH